VHPNDKENIAFITDKGILCNKAIPFELKNIGAMYQQMVNKIFKNQHVRIMKVYVNDMLVKSMLNNIS
jgi:hypothetical protein